MFLLHVSNLFFEGTPVIIEVRFVYNSKQSISKIYIKNIYIISSYTKIILCFIVHTHNLINFRKLIPQVFFK